MTEMAEGALCSMHPEEQAWGACERCGDYRCVNCLRTSPQGVFCVDCLARPEMAMVVFPLGASSWDLGSVLSLAHRTLLREPGLFIGAGAIYLGAHFALGILRAVAETLAGGGMAPMFSPGAPPTPQLGPILAIQGVGILVYVIMDAWLRLGLLAMAIDGARGRTVRLSALVSRAGQILPYVGLGLILTAPFLVAALGVGLAIAAGLISQLPLIPIALGLILMLAAMLAAIYLLGPVQLAQVLLVEQRWPMLRCAREAWRLTRGQRWAVSGSMVVFVILGALGACACYVGIIYTLPLSLLAMVVLSLALCNRPGDPAGTPA